MAGSDIAGMQAGSARPSMALWQTGVKIGTSAYPSAPDYGLVHNFTTAIATLMKAHHFTSVTLTAICAVAVALATLPRALSEPATEANAKGLLDEAKKNQQERKRAAMQKELDRLNEDVKKGKQEMADLEQSISKVNNAAAETKGSLDRLAGRKRNVNHDLELLALRTDAERLKAEGLALLNAAHAKAMEALTKHNEELDLKTALLSAEIQKASESGKTGDAEPRKTRNESSPTLTELRRNLDKAQTKCALADYRAREAMDTASLRLQQAEAAAAKVEKKQAEFDAADKNPGSPDSDAPAKAKAKS